MPWPFLAGGLGDELLGPHAERLERRRGAPGELAPAVGANARHEGAEPDRRVVDPEPGHRVRPPRRAWRRHRGRARAPAAARPRTGSEKRPPTSTGWGIDGPEALLVGLTGQGGGRLGERRASAAARRPRPGPRPGARPGSPAAPRSRPWCPTWRRPAPPSAPARSRRPGRRPGPRRWCRATTRVRPDGFPATRRSTSGPSESRPCPAGRGCPRRRRPGRRRGAQPGQHLAAALPAGPATRAAWLTAPA